MFQDVADGLPIEAKSDLTFYHGGPRGLRMILPPETTGARSIAAEINSRVCSRSRIYVTTDYAAAVMYASVVERGTVYEVRPVGPIEHDPDCSTIGLSYQCLAAKITRELRPKGKHLKLARKAVAA